MIFLVEALAYADTQRSCSDFAYYKVEAQSRDKAVELVKADLGDLYIRSRVTKFNDHENWLIDKTLHSTSG